MALEQGRWRASLPVHHGCTGSSYFGVPAKGLPDILDFLYSEIYKLMPRGTGGGVCRIMVLLWEVV